MVEDAVSVGANEGAATFGVKGMDGAKKNVALVGAEESAALVGATRRAASFSVEEVGASAEATANEASCGTVFDRFSRGEREFRPGTREGRGSRIEGLAAAGGQGDGGVAAYSPEGRSDE